jgi:uncharacterized membrane protein
MQRSISTARSRSLLLLAGGVLRRRRVCRDRPGNVPLNNQLAALAPTATSQALAFWKETYMTRWVALNSLRTLACFLASGFTLAALIIR